MDDIIYIYTDGACKGNPGPGGYGLVLLSGNLRKEVSEGYRLTTNNRMELLSVIVGLECLKKEKTIVTVYSDSKYVVDAVEKKWVFSWEKKNFTKKKNPDLWKRFCEEHATLFNLTCEEYSNLLKTDLEKLEKTIAEKDTIINRINALEKLRFDLISEINEIKSLLKELVNGN